jgi:precorrin-3B synthase
LLAPQACAIADAADACASGVVELTNRANLQIRGVKPEAEVALTRQLSDAGLGPRVDANESLDNPMPAEQQALLVADDARNLLVSPAAGLDAAALYDTTPLAEQILAALQNDIRLVELSPKFSVLLDGGEQLAVLDHPHDVWFAAMAPATNDAIDDPRFAVGLAGQPSAHGRAALAAVVADDIVPLLRALLHTFLDLAAPDENRMRDLLRSHDRHAIVAQAAARAGIELQRDAAVGAWRCAVAEATRRFGAHRQRQSGLWYVGAQPPLGRLDTATLRALARLASIHGDGTLRCTPWQSVLVPYVAQRDVPQVEDELRSLGFVLHADDPLARLIACAGSAGCVKGLADTKADALDLAARLPAGIEVHLTGCTRSCAAAHCAPYTLLAVERGRYDLYRRRHDPAHDRDASQALDGALRFGERIAIDLNIEEAAKQLGEAARSDHP